MVTAARLRLVPRAAGPVTVIIGLRGPGEVHALARQALRAVPGLLSAEFFTRAGLDVLAEHAGLAPPLRDPVPAYPAAGGGRAGRARGPGRRGRRSPGGGGAPRRRTGPGCGPTGSAIPRRPGSSGCRSSSTCRCPPRSGSSWPAGSAAVVRSADPGATVDHLRSRRGREPARQHRARGRRRTAGTRTRCSRFVASLGGSISAEHGIGALKARWLPLVRSDGRARAVRPDQVGVRPGRDTQPARAPALSRSLVPARTLAPRDRPLALTSSP